MSDMQNIVGAFENSKNDSVKNHLRLALNTMMLEACGIVRYKRVDPNKLTPAEVRIGEFEGKIPCIKAYRGRLNCSLFDAKDAVENEFIRVGKVFGPKY